MTFCLGRREFITLLSSAAAWPLVARGVAGRADAAHRLLIACQWPCSRPIIFFCVCCWRTLSRRSVARAVIRRLANRAAGSAPASRRSTPRASAAASSRLTVISVTSTMPVSGACTTPVKKAAIPTTANPPAGWPGQGKPSGRGARRRSRVALPAPAAGRTARPACPRRRTPRQPEAEQENAAEARRASPPRRACAG